tara:strand:+ start:27 stop:263 length:237 start_codon:yes stop_codon:yes gene_type:complete
MWRKMMTQNKVYLFNLKSLTSYELTVDEFYDAFNSHDTSFFEQVYAHSTKKERDDRAKLEIAREEKVKQKIRDMAGFA